jgi:hypothetical protein
MTSEPTRWQDLNRDNPEYFATEPVAAGYPDPVPGPNTLRRGGGGAPVPGSPHANAIRLFLGHIRDDEARLVHGTVTIDGERRPHAWIELPGELVWDGGTRRFYDRDAWIAALQPEADRRHTHPEAARLLLVTNDPGPWND